MDWFMSTMKRNGLLHTGRLERDVRDAEVRSGGLIRQSPNVPLSEPHFWAVGH